MLLSNVAVLLVEDNWIVAASVSDTLTDAGATVVGPAISVAEAMDFLQSSRIDVAILDFRLEGETLHLSPVRCKIDLCHFSFTPARPKRHICIRSLTYFPSRVLMLRLLKRSGPFLKRRNRRTPCSRWTEDVRSWHHGRVVTISHVCQTTRRCSQSLLADCASVCSKCLNRR